MERKSQPLPLSFIATSFFTMCLLQCKASSIENILEFEKYNTEYFILTVITDVSMSSFFYQSE